MVSMGIEPMTMLSAVALYILAVVLCIINAHSAIRQALWSVSEMESYIANHLDRAVSH